MFGTLSYLVMVVNTLDGTAVELPVGDLPRVFFRPLIGWMGIEREPGHGLTDRSDGVCLGIGRGYLLEGGARRRGRWRAQLLRPADKS
jgi:hypothetical protein